MRVGVVSPYDLSTPGGVQSQVLGLARELRALGHEVEIVAPGRPRSDPDVTTVGRSFRIPVNGSIAPMAPPPWAARRTLSALRRGRFDVLHLHEPLAPSITISALLAHPAPVVGTFHAAGDHTPYRWLGRSLRTLARRVDARVAVSDPAEQLARRYLGGTYEVLFNGIDRDRFDKVAPTPVDGPTILFLGRHEPRKGLEVLLEAMSAVPSDVALWVGGDGPDHGRLRQRFGGDPRIHWLGRLSDDDKTGRLRGASVVCAPSLHGESFGIVLLEAMAAGTPVVASDVSGYRSLAADGRAALLVPAGDPAALAGALVRLLGDSALGDELRVAGEERIQGLTMDELARRYVAIYERIA